MPARNIVKKYGAGEYYHVYNRGVAKMDIFREDEDYVYMLHLLKRHLSEEPSFDKNGREIKNYSSEIDLIAFCLMPNHYHFVVYLKEADGLERLMRSVMTSYSLYFNKKYARVGTLFQNHFLASRITDESYFWHISRYVHLNPVEITGGQYADYPFSSYEYFMGNKSAEWVHPEYFVETEADRVQYRRFMDDYVERRDLLKAIEHQMAHT